MEIITFNGINATHWKNFTNIVKRSGYDLPIYGLNSGQFLSIQLPAIICIFCSLIGALGVVIVSFTNKKQEARTFYKWTKCERLAVYMAICDSLFNICHSMDHLQMVITRDHVYPKQLCEFYAFTLVEFKMAQYLMANVISINIFVLIYFDKKISFGRCDAKLLVWIFGFPFMIALVALVMGILGPTGVSCYIDGVKGKVYELFFDTIPILMIVVINSTLYCLTWIKIRQQEDRMKSAVGQKAFNVRSSHRAARRMSLFVVAFFIQWFPSTIYTLWHSYGIPPIVATQLVLIFPNIGGVLNGVVYYIIRPRDRPTNIQSKEFISKRKIAIIIDERSVSYNGDSSSQY